MKSHTPHPNLQSQLTVVVALYAEVPLPLAPGTLPHDKLFFGGAKRVHAGRNIGIRPQSLLLAFLTLVHDPVVVTFIDDVSFVTVQCRRANAAVPFLVLGQDLFRGQFRLNV